MKFTKLTSWLSYIESIHATEIDLGLARISEVAQRMHIQLSKSQVITVAGTNGKGTTCAFLENALLEKGKTVAVYSSPHINAFNERLRINRVDIDDQSLIDAFELVELNRQSISLTYYEFTTLACLLIMQMRAPDYIILEVGLGGRLDATNIISPDVAVITTIDLDHQAFLGNTRELIGVEKAGIFRANKQAVVGEPDLPNSVKAIIAKKNVLADCREQEFTLNKENDCWHYQHHKLSAAFCDLNYPHIPLDNVATAITVLLHLDFTVDAAFINEIIAQTKVPGRMELICSAPKVILDVGHNPQAGRYLASQLPQLIGGKVLAVVAMLADKDIKNSVAPLTNIVDNWYVAGLDVSRGASKDQMLSVLNDLDCRAFGFDNVVDAYKMAISKAQPSDLVVVFGSFFTVAKIKQMLKEE